MGLTSVETRRLGETDVVIPRLVHGTSSLGNLYEAMSPDDKLAICGAWFEAAKTKPVIIDSAGKYGAGLALETLGDCLRRLNIPAEDVVISNKLGWKRVPLRTQEPTFEPGVWRNLQHDAEQCISYRGIIECWEQGLELLRAPYRPQLASVHDPDEYLAVANNGTDRSQRWESILGAYRALHELKDRGEIQAVGVGSKDWTVIAAIVDSVQVDWIMLAGCLTTQRHPPQLLQFVNEVSSRDIGIINSAVFQSGFLAGGRFLDYRVPDRNADAAAFAWREAFLALCTCHSVSPAAACVQFALSPPGVAAVALNSNSSQQVAENSAIVDAPLSEVFWQDAKRQGLIASTYPWV